jgi:hypothetical protein
MAPIDGDLYIRTGEPRTVREALDEARQAKSPADAVNMLYLAVAYSLQQIEELEIALGLIGTEPGNKAQAGINVRARRALDEKIRREQ